VRDAEVIEVLRSGFERSPVRNSQRKVVETDRTFIEFVADHVRVSRHLNEESAWVDHVPSLEIRRVAGVDELEAHDFFPPADAALDVRDREGRCARSRSSQGNPRDMLPHK
jgi:hypothetical protein